jgi:YEATS domain-containing protein 4
MSAQTRRVRGVTVYRPIIYGNSTTLLTEPERQGTDHTHRWTVGIRSAASQQRLNPHPNHQIGGADDLS